MGGSAQHHGPSSPCKLKGSACPTDRFDLTERPLVSESRTFFKGQLKQFLVRHSRHGGNPMNIGAAIQCARSADTGSRTR